MQLAPDELRLGLFALEPSCLNMKKFVILRTFTPKKEYIQIKNRVNSRLNRLKRKDELTSLQEENQRLLKQNQRLKRILEEKTQS